MQNKYFKTDDQHQIIDIYQFFNYYNTFFFNGVLEKCYVQWSTRMTLCAGTCTHSSHQSCTIKLSAPILKFRTANQLKQTLLHEMIHAFLFLTNPSACRTEGGHGKQFQEIMHSINSITGLKITIFHSFHQEVNNSRTHIWRCNGPCKDRPPFYGYVKRAMNRKPQPADHWFAEHQRTCGGQFVKISQPQKVQKKTSKQKKYKHSGKTLDDYVRQMNAQGNKQGNKKKKNSGKTIDDYFNEMKNKSQKKSVQMKGPAKTIAQYVEQMQNEDNLYK